MELENRKFDQFDVLNIFAMSYHAMVAQTTLFLLKLDIMISSTLIFSEFFLPFCISFRCCNDFSNSLTIFGELSKCSAGSHEDCTLG